MSDVTAEKLGQRITDSGLMDSHQLESVWSELGTRDITLEQFTSMLLRREFLTNYQLDRLLKGEKGGFFYGDYKVLYLVGTGTFARVYRAVNIKTAKVVALKALRKRFRAEPGMTEQFIREGQIGAKLRHPNIVPIYEVSEKPSPYMTMEFVEGRNLREFLKVRKSLPPIDSLRLGVDIFAGLAYAFEHGMTHRDLKTSNVLVTSRGRAKLVDFGLAGLQKENSLKEDDLNNPRTIDYAGLERASGVRNNDPRSDLFFAGCILYNMIGGEPPLSETKDRMSRLSVQRYQNIRPLHQLVPDIPNRLLAFVNRALEMNPDRRFGSAAEMHEEGKRVLARLESGDLSESEQAAEVTAPKSGAPLTIASDQEGSGKTVMLVESRIDIQDQVRERLKKHGYKVLVFSDPVRALGRFTEYEPAAADCVLFSTVGLGDDALEAFNRFGTAEHTKNLPAILFVDSRQAGIVKSAQLSPKRRMLQIQGALKVREIRDALLALLRPGYIRASAAAADES
ncbi:Serine/threonine-protein kinase PknB [Anatilimnocola aggregata]|uniref:Serine/threonine-protein kinase PknB n=1 Tax=Anatilimnocola aggregata TaxID=2528021 RepID=A0A517Y5H1_9BACT|nr:serine/threonine-protein kinase [Anatilimnocola aggregata]QDU25440.1 Serine/threonine-protein kinase PknB [Anatilimnocola aggregata]